MNLDYIRQVAAEAALSVGDRIRRVLKREEEFEVHYKAANDPVTNIDIWAEQQIVEKIRAAFPKHVVVGEESYRQGFSAQITDELQATEGVWHIDPIDGTTNFSWGIPYVGVSIGFSSFGKRLAGVVYDPARGELFSAIQGGGATLNGAPIGVHDMPSLDKAVIATGLPRDRTRVWYNYTKAYDAIFSTPCDIRRFGAASLDQCWVALGRVHASFEHKLSPWDVAAGSLIVEEAGGRICNFVEGGEFSIYKDTFLFSTPGIFEELRAMLCREV